MKISLKIFSLVFFASLASSCDSNNKRDARTIQTITKEGPGTFTIGATAQRLRKFDEASSIDKRAAELFVFPRMKKIWKETGCGYDIKTLMNDWEVYKDNDYYIICGAIARSVREVEVFTMVWQNYPEGRQSDVVLECVYIEIGNQNQGNYPSGVIPYK